MHPEPWTCCCFLQELACGFVPPASCCGRKFTGLQCRHSTRQCCTAPLVLHCCIIGHGSPSHHLLMKLAKSDHPSVAGAG